MRRLLLLLVLLAGSFCVTGESPAASGSFASAIPAMLLAQAEGPDQWNDAHSIRRPESPLLNPIKLALLWVVFVIWVRTADWINRDCQLFNLGYAKWNLIAFIPFLVALLLAFFVPFVVGMVLTVAVWLGVFITYTVVHNKAVEEHQKVFTPSWWRHWFAEVGDKLGMKISAEKKAAHEKGAPVDLAAKGGATAVEDNANLLKARQSPGYLLVKELVVDMVNKRSDKLLLDYTPQAVAQKYQIDGVWHNGDVREREPADVMLAVIKTLANLDINERRKRQQGMLGAKYEGRSFHCHVDSQGTQTGERVVVSLERPGLKFETLEDLGMREKMRGRWLEFMGLNQGFIVISTLPGGGLTTLVDTSIEETDRLMRDWVSVEDVHHPERELENVDVATYDSAAGETPATVLPKVIRQYPDVYLVRDFKNAETGNILVREVNDERLVITTMRAKDGVEAMLRLLQLGIDRAEFAAVINAVLHQRLVRKLCEHCRVGYAPTADMLQKLGIPQGRVQAFYRAPRPEEIDKPCQHCSGLGFQGRTAVFELVEVSDEMRQILAKQPKLDLLRRAARNAGVRSLQEEGVLLVAKGVTSLPELMRVLKQ